METKFSHRRHARQILDIEGEHKALKNVIAFSEKDAVDIHRHNDDPLVITDICDESEIKRVLIDKDVLRTLCIWRHLKDSFLT